MNDKEIEIQVQIEKAEPLLNFLEKHGDFKYESRQTDEYFTPSHRDFIAIRPVKEWLRLRTEAGRHTITYKNWHYGSGGRSYHADEYETQVADLASLKKLFLALNFKPLTAVDKTRRVFQYKDYEIALDSIKNLGEFVEIEYKGRARSEAKVIYNEMVEFLRGLNCGKIRRNNGGYPFLLMFPEEAKYEEI
ncbi:MAG: class IV adenylate cyclase [Patescibacteria group bacterium]|nr:class IV adenylate cyclase [Patescibacteria group bacterium]